VATQPVHVLFDLPSKPEQDAERVAINKEVKDTSLELKSYTVPYIKPKNVFTFRLFTVDGKGKRVIPVFTERPYAVTPGLTDMGLYGNTNYGNNVHEFGMPSSKAKFKDGKQGYHVPIQHGTCNFEVGQNEIVAQSSSFSCLAYKNDGLWGTVRFFLEGNKHELYCRNLYHKRPLFYGTTMPYSTWQSLPKKGQSLTDKSEAMLRYAINIYVQLPLMLLDPDPEGPRWSKKIKPATEGITFGEQNIFVKHRPNIIFSPGLTWLASALTREAGHLAEPAGTHTTYRLNGIDQNVLRLFTKLIGPEDLVQIIDEGNYQEAANVWDKIRPIFAAFAEQGAASSLCWWITHSAASQTKPFKSKGTISSVREFERIILEGGWPSLGTSMRDTWNLAVGPLGGFKAHAATARAWEGLLYDRRQGPPTTKIAKLGKSIPTIRAKCEDSMAKIPWITG